MKRIFFRLAAPLAGRVRPGNAPQAGRLNGTTAVPFVVLACLLAGCQSAKVPDPVTRTSGGTDDDAQMEFWHTLADRPVTCNDDAFHGFLLDLDGKDDAKTYDDRVVTLKARKLIPQAFAEPADQAVSRGTLAVAIAQALHITGGWAMHVFGPTPRYATRELQYLNLYPPSSPNQTFTGAEFLGVMGKFEDAQHADTQTATQGAEPPAAVQPGRTLTDSPDLLQPADRQPTEPK